jgi:hypothetical protein
MVNKLLTIAAALALVAGLSGAASAQVVCQLGPSDGAATISPGLHGDSLGDATFFFTAPCGAGTNVCSNGTLSAASCAGNVTAGQYVLCAGPCSGGTTGALTCAAPIVSDTFNGVCAGALCTGGSDTVAYALVFDEDTINRAQTECSSAAGLTSAHFGGPIVYKY